MVVTFGQVGATLSAAPFVLQHDVKCGFHIRTFRVCISRYSRYTIWQSEMISIFSNGFAWHLTRWNSIRTKTKWLDYYASTLLLILIKMWTYPLKVRFSSKYKKTQQCIDWLSAVIQQDQESFDVLNQAFNTCNLHFKFRFLCHIFQECSGHT